LPKPCYGIIFLLLLIPTTLRAAELLQVIVEGLEGAELKNVQAALALPPGLVQDGQVNQRWLRLFEERIPERVRSALEPFGYYEAQVKTSLVVEQGVYRLYVRVEPGEPVRVASVKMNINGPGANEEKLKELVRKFPLKEGDVLRQDVYEETKGTLKSRAVDLGYLDADFSIHVIRLSLEEKKATIELVLETGPQYRFGEVIFVGAATYPDAFLKRYLAFRQGEPLSYSKVTQTQLNLINSDRFKEVTVEPMKKDAHNEFVPITVRLTTSPPKRLRVGVGYETDIGARFATRYQDLNFNHWGHELNAELNIAQRLQGFVTSYVVPSRKNLDSKLSTKLGIQQEDMETYDSRAIFVEPEYVHGLGGGKLASAYVQIRLEDFTIGEQEGRSRLVLPGLRFSQRRYDDLIRPKKGFRYALEMRGTDKFLGSDTGFFQTLVNGDLLVPLPWRFSLLARSQGGFTILSDPFRDLPASVRFFAGGDRSVRGYAYQSLGTKDAEGNVIGGKHLLVGSIELERPILKIFGLAAFYDVGNAFNTFRNMDLQQGAGIGIRVYTPVGPIRLDLARQIGVRHPDFRVHFTVGLGL
jgi:translocation and assembly module TamA